jgi:hypothetical protein
VAIQIEAIEHLQPTAGGGSRSAWSTDVATVALPAPAEGTATHTLVIETRSTGAIGVTHG